MQLTSINYYIEQKLTLKTHKVHSLFSPLSSLEQNLLRFNRGIVVPAIKKLIAATFGIDEKNIKFDTGHTMILNHYRATPPYATA